MAQEENNVNPNMVWMQYYDYLRHKGESMKQEYIKKLRTRTSFSWQDIEDMCNKINEDLAYLKSWEDLAK